MIRQSYFLHRSSVAILAQAIFGSSPSPRLDATGADNLTQACRASECVTQHVPSAGPRPLGRSRVGSARRKACPLVLRCPTLHTVCLTRCEKGVKTPIARDGVPRKPRSN